MPAHRTSDEERAASVTHLLALEAAGTPLTLARLKTVAAAHGCSPKSVQRWLQRARDNDGHYQRKQRDAAEVTERMEDELIRWCGNISSAHQALTDDGILTLSYSAFYCAVMRTYPRSYLDGLRGGEKARRRHDLHGSNRDRGRRNDAWEADHKEADVWVNVNGTARKPWLTLFVNCSNDGICGWAVTPHTPNSQAIIVALHHAVQRGGPHWPFGGVPTLIRVDRGTDFLSDAVHQAMGILDIDRVALPPRRPDLKPYVESLNKSFKNMLFRGMPGYTECPAPDTAATSKPPPVEDLLTFERFTTEVSKFVHRWNHEHRIRNLDNRTPLEVWRADQTVIHDPPPAALRRSLPFVRRTFTITGTGIDWQGRDYLETWMHDLGGTRVRLRHLPGYFDTVEVYDAADDKYFGTARWTNAASTHLMRRVRETNAADAARLRKALERRSKIVAERFAATAESAPPRLLTTLTTEQAHQHLHDTRDADLLGTPGPVDENLPEPTGSWTNTHPPQPCTDIDDNLPAPTPSWITHPAPPTNEPEDSP